MNPSRVSGEKSAPFLSLAVLNRQRIAVERAGCRPVVRDVPREVDDAIRHGVPASKLAGVHTLKEC